MDNVLTFLRHYWVLVLSLITLGIVTVAVVFLRPDLWQRNRSAQQSQETPPPVTVNTKGLRPLFEPATPAQLATIDLTRLQDPFLSEPCFYSGYQTCQPLINGPLPTSLPATITFTYTKLPRYQDGPAYRTLLIHLYAYRGSFFDAMLTEFDPTKVADWTYYTYLSNIVQMSTKSSMNPAFVYAYYEHLFATTKERNLGQRQRGEFPVPPVILTGQLQQMLTIFQTEKPLRADPLYERIKSLPMSAAGKAVIYTSYQHLQPSLVEAMFDRPGAIEERYDGLMSVYGVGGKTSEQKSQQQFTNQLTLTFYESEIKDSLTRMPDEILKKAINDEFLLCIRKDKDFISITCSKQSQNEDKALSCLSTDVFLWRCKENAFGLIDQ